MTDQISDLKVCFDVNHLYTESHEDFVEKMVNSSNCFEETSIRQTFWA